MRTPVLDLGDNDFRLLLYEPYGFDKLSRGKEERSCHCLLCTHLQPNPVGLSAALRLDAADTMRAAEKGQGADILERQDQARSEAKVSRLIPVGLTNIMQAVRVPAHRVCIVIPQQRSREAQHRFREAVREAEPLRL